MADSEAHSTPFTRVPAPAWSPIAQFLAILHQLLPGAALNTLQTVLWRYFLPTTHWHTTLYTLVKFLGTMKAGRPGYGQAFGITVFAILANHVRRVLLPESGVGGFRGPIGMLKLAAGSPTLFLEEEFEKGMGRNWGLERRVFVRLGFDSLGLIAGSWLVYFVDKMERRKEKNGDERLEKKEEQAADYETLVVSDQERKTLGDDDKRQRAWGCVAAVAVMVWALGSVEYLHARAVHVAAVGVAYWKMWKGGEVYWEALVRLFVPEGKKIGSLEDPVAFAMGFWRNEMIWRILQFHVELIWYLCNGVYASVRLAAASAIGLRKASTGKGCTWKWEPTLALLAAGWAWTTGYLTMYSNKYYIVLEMSDLLLVGWWSLLGVLSNNTEIQSLISHEDSKTVMKDDDVDAKASRRLVGDITDCDPSGDLYLHVGAEAEGKTKTYLVCSKALSRASPVFQRMLYGDFAESRQSDAGYNWTIDLTDDRQEPLELLLHIIHGNFEQYDVTRVTRPWAERWMMGVKADRHSPLPLAVAYEMGDHEVFNALGMKIATECQVDSDEEIQNIRKKLLNTILTPHIKLYRHLRTENRCPPRNQTDSGERCDSMLLGSLIRSLAGQAVDITAGDPVQDYRGSVSALQATVHRLELYTIHSSSASRPTSPSSFRYGQSSNTWLSGNVKCDCSHALQVHLREGAQTSVILRGQTTFALPRHKEYLAKQARKTGLPAQK
ncbi:hypothetical protein C8034_v001434 [Colletotrichum sidae]|uniref:BTB domain-containing protein n=1 Tax=Colletotrichum sidae TaxID=1347389 RepID=A0A4R8SUT3_9PEZI|nr:hypothetical protein C8034_v001434 [Colletotrichum sidae]